MTTVAFICAALASFAWIWAEAKVERLQAKLAVAKVRLDELYEEERLRRADDIVRRRRPNAKHWQPGTLDRLIHDIDHAGRLHLVGDGEDAA